MKARYAVAVLTLGATLWLAGALAPAQESQETRQRVTVIRPGADGETQVITVDKTTREDGERAESAVRPQRVWEADDAPRKARIMVMTATFAQERRRRLDRVLNEVFGIADPGIWESPGFTSYVVDALVNTRKFDILERTALDNLVREMEFGESDYADPAKVSVIGQMLGADYAVIPEIRYLELDRSVARVPYIATEQTTLDGKLATTMRTVDVATGRIIASSIDEVDRRVRPRPGTAERIAVADILGEMFKEISLREASNVADVAYPIRVMSISGDTVMLNRGRGALLEGEELRVFAAGEMLIDPDTGESLGYDEAYVGAVRVTEIGQRTSRAVITEEREPIQRLAICRRTRAPSRRPAIKTQPPPKID